MKTEYTLPEWLLNGIKDIDKFEPASNLPILEGDEVLGEVSDFCKSILTLNNKLLLELKNKQMILSFYKSKGVELNDSDIEEFQRLDKRTDFLLEFVKILVSEEFNIYSNRFKGFGFRDGFKVIAILADDDNNDTRNHNIGFT